MKLLLTICFCLLPLTASADHWVYIRTYDRPTVDPEQIAVGTYGRSKKGDIVDIRPINSTTYPSEISQKEWAIIKVKGLTEKDITKYTEVRQVEIGTDNDGNPIYRKIADRRHKLDIDILGLDKVGLYPNAIDFNTIVKPKIREKVEQDLIAYHRQGRWYAMRRPFIYAYHRVLRSVQAEEVSTINWAGETYDTLTLWEDARDGDLVTATKQETASCYDDDGDLNDELIIDDSTTDATYYLKVTSPVGERHAGTAASGFKFVSNGTWESIACTDAWTVIEWLIVNANQRDRGVSVVANNCYINNCIMYNADENGMRINSVSAIMVNDCLSYKNDREGYRVTDYGGSTFRNCTSYGNGIIGIYDGWLSTWGNPILINCLSDSNTGEDFDTANGWHANSTYNMSSDDTAPETGTWYDNASNTFADTGSDDYHLAVGDDAIDAGSDLGDIQAAIDIDGRNRHDEGDTWDVGADEYVSAAPPSFIPKVWMF